MAKKLHSFLFADICGYSKLTELDGDEAAADLAIRFASMVSSMAPDHGSEVVKHLGDAVMVRGESAAQILELGLRLQADPCEKRASLQIHSGIHTGPAVERAGDWWGTTVNIAARVAAAAQAGQLLITEATKEAVGEIGSTELSALGPQLFKNIQSPVQLYLVCRWGNLPLVAEDQNTPARDSHTHSILPWTHDRDPVPGSSLAFEG
jgi:adenylate cyclase